MQLDGDLVMMMVLLFELDDSCGRVNRCDGLRLRGDIGGICDGRRVLGSVQS